MIEGEGLGSGSGSAVPGFGALPAFDVSSSMSMSIVSLEFCSLSDVGCAMWNVCLQDYAGCRWELPASLFSAMAMLFLYMCV
jgi:hypothetical protein